MTGRILFLLSCGLLLSAATDGISQVSFTKHTISSNLTGAYWVYARDINGDGKLDLVTAEFQGISVWTGNGSGGFSRRSLGSLSGAWSAFAEDIDGDGKVDALGSSPTTDEIVWYKNNGGGFSGKRVIDSAGQDPESVAAADFDNDGDGDVVAALWQDGQIAWYENKGGSWTKHILDANVNGAHSVYVADFNKDGRIDIVAGGSGKTNWYSNSGNGNFSKRSLSSSGSWGVFAADVDRDGKMDILRTQRNNGDVDWFKNSGGSFSEKNIAANFGESWSVSAGDVDGDGDIDITAAGFDANNISVWFNDGGNKFGGAVIVDNVNKPRSVFVARLDQDGNSDIAAAVRGDRDLNWYGAQGAPPKQTLALVAPNGGESLTPGTVFTISWNAANINNVDIEFSQDGGASWTTVASAVSAGSGHNWTVPALESQQCLIRVSDAADGTPADESDATFTITSGPQSIRLLAPNGGESIAPGATFPISWSSTNINNVDIEFSQDGGASWTTVASAVSAGNAYNWTIPALESQQCLIRVSDAADGTPADESDATFTITSGPQSIRLLAPNGGESIAPGATFPISWSSTNVNNVDIEFSQDGGANWTSVASAVPAGPGYSWTVPVLESRQCLIRVSDAADGAPADESDATFTVTSGPKSIQVVSPNGGEQIEAGSLYSIAWTSTGFIPQVDIELSTDAGAAWQTISSGANNDGSFAWQTPNLSATASLIRIADSSDSTVVDSSDAPFEIIQPPPAPPVITGFEPTAASPGDSVQITGADFVDVASVTFGGVSAWFAVRSARLIDAVVPDSALSGRIVVTSLAGVAESPADFTVLAPGQVVRSVYRPSSDAQVRLNVPAKNFGQTDFLKIQKDAFQSYLKFEVTDSTANLVDATLRLFARNSGGSGGVVYQTSGLLRDLSAPWDESNLTAGNAPDSTGPPVWEVAAVAESSFVDFNVTGVISEEGIYSFVIRSDSTDLIRYDSKEANFPPELILTKLAPPKPAKINPIALDDSVVAVEDSSVTIRPLVNDSDPDGMIAPATFSILTFPEFGAIALDTLNATVLYTPAADFFGPDSFTYAVQDTDGLVSEPATVRIEVRGVNDPPVALDDSASARAGVDLILDLLANDTDIDDGLDSTSITLVDGPKHGSVAVYALTARVTYRPDEFFAGADTFSYKVKDAGGMFSNVAFVRLSVSAVNHRPVIRSFVPREEQLEAGASDSIVFSVDAVDPDGDALRFTWRLDGAIVDTSTAKYVFVTAEQKPDAHSVTVEISDGVLTDSLSWSIDVVTRVETSPALPKRFFVSRNYPNPFNPETTIRLELPTPAKVVFTIFNIRGAKVRTLKRGDLAAGYHTFSWDGKDARGLQLPSGVYFYRFEAKTEAADQAAFVSTGKMTLLR